MYLKIMSGENAPDGDSRKTFRILDEVIAVNFDRITDSKDALAVVTFKVQAGSPPTTETFWLEGNCYLMNEAGDTIASFGVAPYRV